MAVKNRTNKQWQEIIADFAQSQLPMGKYCQDNNIQLGKLRYRYYKSKPILLTKRQEPRFVELKLPTPTSFNAENNVKVTLHNGINLEIKTLDIIGLIKGLANVL